MDTYVTMRGVELAKVGDWPTYKGDGTITRQHLQDIADAYRDQEIREALHGDPVGWCGHVDSIEAAQARQDEPAVGRVTNVRVAGDGDLLVADIVDVPERVARAYPRRSVELQANVTTPSGKTYTRVLSGLAHLGRKRGAIRGLRDYTALLDGRDTPVLAAEGDPIVMATSEDEDFAIDDLSHLTSEEARRLGYLD